MQRPWLGYLFLMRVPLLVALWAGTFRWLALSSGLSPYLLGFYDLDRTSARWVAISSGLLWLCLVLTSDVILRNSAARSLVRPLPLVLVNTIRVLGWNVMRVTLALSALYLIVILILLSGFASAGQPGAFIGALEGLAVFASVFALLFWLYGRWDRGRPPRPAWVALVMRILGSPAGFFDAEQRPLPGHRFSQNAFFGFLAIYLWFGWKGWALIERPHISGPTAFLCALFLITVLCWLFSGLAFIFDRWRFPVLALIALVWAAGSGMLGGHWFERTDHIYQTRTIDAPLDLPRPADLLRPRSGRVVLVAVSGGGIFSAGWATQVLGALAGENPEFASTVRLVSAVSGGSVGAMYWLDAFHDGTFAPVDAEPVFARATRSSLAHAAWGMAYPDLLRTAFPWTPQQVDRGWALEQAWVRDSGPGAAGASLRGTTLGDWSRQPSARPALALNSTVIESGERFVFSTYRPESLEEPLTRGRVFFEEFPRHDLPVVTAARLSAAFPWISPAARLAGSEETHRVYHLGDGGYYDNFGVVTALEFLRGAFANSTERPQVLLVEIALGPQWNGASQTFPRRGWGYQLIVPPQGYFHVWNTIARARNTIDLSLLRQIYPGLITQVRFDYPAWNTATSWHLSAAEIASLRTAWSSDPNVRVARESVRAFFAAAADVRPLSTRLSQPAAAK